ncbi:MAG: phage capsid protein [Akkermansia sp.]
MNLLRETEVSSYDFNNVKALVEGNRHLHGIQIHPHPEASQNRRGVRSCLA